MGFIAGKNDVGTVAEAAAQYGDKGWELYQGVVIEVSPTKSYHAIVLSNILKQLIPWSILRESSGGQRYHIATAEAGFLLARNPDTLLCPDAAVVDAKALSAKDASGYFESAPLLAIEVASATNSKASLQEKASIYTKAGTTEVWIVYPQERMLEVYMANNSKTHQLTHSDHYRGDDVLSGLEFPISTVFDGLSPTINP